MADNEAPAGGVPTAAQNGHVSEAAARHSEWSDAIDAARARHRRSTTESDVGTAPGTHPVGGGDGEATPVGESTPVDESTARPSELALASPPGGADRRVDGARALRVLAGVDESLLDEVPQERPRYTSLGGVVLGTATLATLSMYVAITQIAGSARWWCLFPALLWGVFVCNLDRWLVASSSGTRWRSRAAVLLPRLLLALAFGFIIAEPLVLKIFESAIEQEVRDSRQAGVAAYEGRLLRCNPVPGTSEAASPEAASTACDVDRFTVSGRLPGLLRQIDELRSQKTGLDASINTDTATLAMLNDTARRECNGTSGDGLSGRVGVGPNCTRNRQEADDFATTTNLAERVKQQTSLSAEIARLEQQTSAATTEYRAERDAMIRSLVDGRLGNQKEIGLLERMEALSALTARHGHLRLAEWAIRIFFVIVDCLPVLVKLMSGTTRYERVVDYRLVRGEVGFRTRVDLEEYEEQKATQAARDDVDEKYRKRAARRDADSYDDVDALTERLLAEHRT